MPKAYRIKFLWVRVTLPRSYFMAKACSAYIFSGLDILGNDVIVRLQDITSISGLNSIIKLNDQNDQPYGLLLMALILLLAKSMFIIRLVICITSGCQFPGAWKLLLTGIQG